MKIFSSFYLQTSAQTSRIFIKAFTAAILCVSTCQAQLRMPAAETDPCDSVKPSQAVEFHGVMLKESPDITSSDLRVIDALLSTRGCVQIATSRLEKYRAAHPDDYQADLLQARILALRGQIAEEGALLKRTLSMHPDFASASVLQASMQLDGNNVGLANVALGKVLKRSPDDLWANLHSLRANLMRSVSPDAAARLIEIATNEKFPDFARESAAVTITSFTTLPLEMREKAYRTQLTFNSATPTSMKTTNLARFLMEDRRDYVAGREILKKYLGPKFQVSADGYAKTLLAESYLLEAQTIAPAPSKMNAALIGQAANVMSGDLSALFPRFARWPELNKLMPLLKGHLLNPAATDQQDQTALCISLRYLDVPSIRIELDLGAKPDSLCDGETILMGAVEAFSTDNDKSTAIAELLLQQGADVDTRQSIGHSPTTLKNPIEMCAFTEKCSEKLMPSLKKRSHPAG